jgi:hypothetical protein
MTEEDRNLFAECLNLINRLQTENEGLATENENLVNELRRWSASTELVNQAACVILRSGEVVIRSQADFVTALKLAEPVIRGYLAQERKATEHLLQ